MYTRGFDVNAPAEYAFRWFAAHAPPERSISSSIRTGEENGTRLRLVHRSHPKNATQKVTRWELQPPDLVIFRDQVFRAGRLVLEGEERYRFLGGGNLGCVAEVTVYRRPVGGMSRLGFACFPERSIRTRPDESELLRELERDFGAGRLMGDCCSVDGEHSAQISNTP